MKLILRSSFSLHFFFFLFPQLSFADIDSGEDIHRLWTGVGVLAQNTGRFASSSSGASSHLNSIYPLLVVTGRFGSPSWAFSPLLSYAPISRKTADSGTSSNILNIGARLTKTFGSFEILLGLGDFLYWVGGSGGTASLNNGTGTTTFGFARTKNLTTQLYLDFGVAYTLFKKFRMDVDINMLGAGSSSKRSINAVLSLSMGFF